LLIKSKKKKVGWLVSPLFNGDVRFLGYMLSSVRAGGLEKMWKEAVMA
jgi:hypothetical protein